MENQFTFEKMRVWQALRQFVKDIYFITNLFPKEEKYCLVDQLRRAVISISSNIADGSSRSSLKDQAHFTNLAYSNPMEVLNQSYIANDLNIFLEKYFQNWRRKSRKF